ncbi:MAG: sodium:alanine symporter family protein, partial [Myxococcales bacterium]|nr:sodium:alanine symporter family protein [Myxococcales bacterium]
MEPIHALLNAVDGIVWGPLTIVLLVGTGLYLTARVRFLQFTKFRLATRIVSGEFDNPDDTGEITHFQALAAALSATIGTGNIAGVATAIASGGPGAVFWMWVTALVGMVTKYAECTLSLKYREVNSEGAVSGGPMYTIQNGMGPRWKWMGTLFAVFAAIAAFGIGNMVQSNSVADAAAGFAANSVGVRDERVLFGIKVFMGLALSTVTGLVIIGGIRRIAQVAARLVPAMCVFYVVGGLAVVILHLDALPEAVALIFRGAFTPTAAAGGFAGAMVMQTIRYGVARGVFSNEAGLGSAPMAHAAAKTEEPVREGLVAMMGPFIDTIVV